MLVLVIVVVVAVVVVVGGRVGGYVSGDSYFHYILTSEIRLA